jgi:hypothetical protein
MNPYTSIDNNPKNYNVYDVESQNKITDTTSEPNNDIVFTNDKFNEYDVQLNKAIDSLESLRKEIKTINKKVTLNPIQSIQSTNPIEFMPEQKIIVISNQYNNYKKTIRAIYLVFFIIILTFGITHFLSRPKKNWEHFSGQIESFDINSCVNDICNLDLYCSDHKNKKIESQCIYYKFAHGSNQTLYDTFIEKIGSHIEGHKKINSSRCKKSHIKSRINYLFFFQILFLTGIIFLQTCDLILNYMMGKELKKINECVEN